MKVNPMISFRKNEVPLLIFAKLYLKPRAQVCRHVAGQGVNIADLTLDEQKKKGDREKGWKRWEKDSVFHEFAFAGATNAQCREPCRPWNRVFRIFREVVGYLAASMLRRRTLCAGASSSSWLSASYRPMVIRFQLYRALTPTILLVSSGHPPRASVFYKGKGLSANRKGQ